MARGRSSSHATMRSILIAAAIATCCTWVFARPQYRVRRRPKARTPGRVSLRRRPAADSVAGPPRWQTRSAPLPAPRTGPGAAAAAVAPCAWPGYSRAVGHVPHVCLSNATMMGRLPCPPPCSHHATDRWPWGQRTRCWSQSTANCSTVYAPSTCVCHPWLGRGTPQDDALFVTAVDEYFRADIGCIDQVFMRRDALVDQCLLDGRGALRFMDRFVSHVREQVRGGGFTRFADVYHIARPRRVAFVAVARLDIVGRFDALGSRWQFPTRLETYPRRGDAPETLAHTPSARNDAATSGAGPQCSITRAVPLARRGRPERRATGIRPRRPYGHRPRVRPWPWADGTPRSVGYSAHTMPAGSPLGASRVRPWPLR